jgi:hypothetical protein
VPATGSLALAQVFSWAFTKAEARTLAGPAMAPQIAISSPVPGATVTASPVTVSGTVTAGGNGLPRTVVLNGQSVAVNSSGEWSAPVTLTEEVDTITATATDDEGLQATAHVAVSYPSAEQAAQERAALEAAERAQREAGERAAQEAGEKAAREAAALIAAGIAPAAGTAPTPPPAITRASASITKVAYRSGEVLLTVACRPGVACSGKATATAKIAAAKGKALHGGHEQITVASASFTLPAGHSATIKLRLTRTAAKELARLGSLATTVTATLAQTGAPAAALTAHLTLHASQRRP